MALLQVHHALYQQARQANPARWSGPNPDSHEPQAIEPPGAGPHAGWCGRGGAYEGCLLWLPSGKLDTNMLVLSLAAVAYNILRLVGQQSLLKKDAPLRHLAKRRRLKTVMQEIDGSGRTTDRACAAAGVELRPPLPGVHRLARLV